MGIIIAKVLLRRLQAACALRVGPGLGPLDCYRLLVRIQTVEFAKVKAIAPNSVQSVKAQAIARSV